MPKTAKEYLEHKANIETNLEETYKDKLISEVSDLIVMMQEPHIIFKSPIPVVQGDSLDYINYVTEENTSTIFYDEDCMPTNSGGQCELFDLPLDTLAEVSIQLDKMVKGVEIKPDVWVDHGHKMGVRRYEREEALQVIKETLKADKDLRDGRKMKSFSDDDLFEIASNHFSINLED